MHLCDYHLGDIIEGELLGFKNDLPNENFGTFKYSYRKVQRLYIYYLHIYTEKVCGFTVKIQLRKNEV